MRKISAAVCCTIILCVSSGCIKMAIKKYKLGREFNFAGRSQYFKQVSAENAIPISSFLQLDSASYMKFGEGFTGSIYYGIFVNDSVQIQKPAFLMNNQECIGKIGHEIERIMASGRSDTLKTDSSVNLKKYHFFSAITDKPVTIIDPGKKLTIVLIYYYSLGTYYKTLYKELQKVQKKNSALCNIYVVSMDPVCYLK